MSDVVQATIAKELRSALRRQVVRQQDLDEIKEQLERLATEKEDDDVAIQAYRAELDPAKWDLDTGKPKKPNEEAS